MACQRALVLVLVLAAAAGASESAHLVRVEVASASANDSCPWHLTVDGGASPSLNLSLCAGQLALSFQGRLLTGKASPVPDGDDLLQPVSAAPFSTDDVFVDAPPGYVELIHGGFYKVHEEQLSWRLARKACEAEGAHLVVVNSKEEASALKAVLNPDDEATDILHAGFYVDLRTNAGQSLSSLGYERWAPGQPAGPICGRIDADAWLLLGPCLQRRRFVCEWAAGLNITSTTAPPRSEDRPTRPRRNIPEGYAAAPGRSGSYYKLASIVDHSYITDRQEGERKCAEVNADLAVIESVEEAETLMDFWQTIPADDYERDFWQEVTANAYEKQLENVMQRTLFYLGIRSSESLTVLGTSLISTGYSRWVLHADVEIYVCANSKMLFYTCTRSYVKYALCEF